MSSSDHPVARRLEAVAGDPGRLLASVMLLSLVDGIFPALVLSGALSTAGGILQVGLLVFGGSATLAVVLTEMGGTRREAVRTVLAIGAVLVPLAALEAALAPTLASALDLDVFRRFAALVIAAVAAKTASARIGEYLPRPAVIVGLGLVGSLDPGGAALVVPGDPETVARAAAAGLVGVAFALGAALGAPRLRAVVDLDRFRFGSAVALGLLPLSILGLPFGHAPLAAIAVTAVFAYAPDGGSGVPSGDEPGEPTGGTTPAADDAASGATSGEGGAVAGGAQVAAGGSSGDAAADDRSGGPTAEPEVGDGPDEDRPPWF